MYRLASYATWIVVIDRTKRGRVDQRVRELPCHRHRGWIVWRVVVAGPGLPQFDRCINNYLLLIMSTRQYYHTIMSLIAQRRHSKITWTNSKISANSGE